MTTNYDKPFKTLDEQIQLLEDRNLRIFNKNFAREALLTVSYYDLIHGYKEYMMTGKKFKPQVSIDYLFLFHLFDKNFQNIIFKNSTIIENILKTKIAYVLSKNIGAALSYVTVIANRPYVSIFAPLAFQYICRLRYQHRPVRLHIFLIVSHKGEKMNAVIYARYSSDKQRDASIEDQIQECTECAQANSLTVIKTYADRALSGTTDERAQFQLMIKDAAKKQFTQVLIYKTDRFARNRFDAAIYKKKLKEYGVKVVPVKEPIPDGPGGIVMEALYESMAQMYSENLSENVRRSMDGNARKCLANGKPLFGYKIDKSTHRFVVDETQAPVLKHIFEMAAAGKKYAEILKYMADLGYSRYNNWLTTTFRNRRYLGIYIYKDIEVPGVCRSLSIRIRLML